jgi:hypothetical protein
VPPKDLSHLAPVAAQVIIQIRTGDELSPFQRTVAFLHLDARSPGVPISLLVFKKAFQICPGCGRGAFDDQHHITSCSLYQATKLVIALSGISGDQAPFAQDLRQKRLERADCMVVLSYGTWLQDTAGLYLIHLHHLLLRLFSPLDLVARALKRFAIKSQVDAAPSGLQDQAARLLSASALCLGAHHPRRQLGVHLLAVQTRQHLLVRVRTRHAFPGQMQVGTQALWLILNPFACSQQTLPACQFRQHQHNQ